MCALARERAFTDSILSNRARDGLCRHHSTSRLCRQSLTYRTRGLRQAPLRANRNHTKTRSILASLLCLQPPPQLVQYVRATQRRSLRSVSSVNRRGQTTCSPCATGVWGQLWGNRPARFGGGGGGGREKLALTLAFCPLAPEGWLNVTEPRKDVATARSRLSKGGAGCRRSVCVEVVWGGGGGWRKGKGDAEIDCEDERERERERGRGGVAGEESGCSGG